MAIDDIGGAWSERRSLPTDLDRERIRANAEQAVKSLRDGLSKSVLDVHLGGLHGASIQRIYVKLVLRGLVRWLAETLSPGDLMAYAHHVAAQDGAAPASGSMLDKGAAAILRALARLPDESGSHQRGAR